MYNLYTIYKKVRNRVCPKEGIIPKILLWGWDWNPQSYSREGSGFLGYARFTVPIDF